MPPRGRIDRATRDRIAHWIRFKMKELNKNQLQMSEKLGVNPSTVSRALSGGSIGLDLVLAMHRVLGISANALFDGSPEENP